MRNSLRHGFSLVELLVVVAIISVLGLLAMQGLNSSLRASRLTAASDALTSVLLAARQQAIAANNDAEVRFYRYAAGGEPARFRAAQAFVYRADGSARAAGRLVKLPEGIAIAEDESLSSLLEPSREKSWSTEPKPSLANVGTSYDTRVVRFRADGSTDLAPFGTPWFVSVVAAGDADQAGALPANFATIQIDPVTGRLRTFRP
jgi:uncharacterized protein (TIGR02596 family)